MCNSFPCSSSCFPDKHSYRCDNKDMRSRDLSLEKLSSFLRIFAFNTLFVIPLPVHSKSTQNRLNIDLLDVLYRAGTNILWQHSHYSSFCADSSGSAVHKSTYVVHSGEFSSTLSSCLNNESSLISRRYIKWQDGNRIFHSRCWYACHYVLYCVSWMESSVMPSLWPTWISALIIIYSR